MMKCSINCSSHVLPTAKSDFYQWVNKKWLDDPTNTIPDEYSRWGGFIKLQDTSLKNQIALVYDLQNRSVAELNEDELKIRAIWEAASMRFKDWKYNLGTYDIVFKEFAILDSILGMDQMQDGKYQNFIDHADRVGTYLHYTQTNGINNVFVFDKGSNFTNPNNVVLNFQTCGLSLPSREYYTEDNFKEKREMFKQHLFNITKLIKELDADFVQNVIDFENKLAKYKMKREHIRQYGKYQNSTLGDVYTKINDLKSFPEKQIYYPENERNFILEKSQITLAHVMFEKIYDLFDLKRILQTNLKRNFIDANVENPPKVDHLTVLA